MVSAFSSSLCLLILAVHASDVATAGNPQQCPSPDLWFVDGAGLDLAIQQLATNTATQTKQLISIHLQPEGTFYCEDLDGFQHAFRRCTRGTQDLNFAVIALSSEWNNSKFLLQKMNTRLAAADPVLEPSLSTATRYRLLGEAGNGIPLLRESLDRLNATLSKVQELWVTATDLYHLVPKPCGVPPLRPFPEFLSNIMLFAFDTVCIFVPALAFAREPLVRLDLCVQETFGHSHLAALLINLILVQLLVLSMYWRLRDLGVNVVAAPLQLIMGIFAALERHSKYIFAAELSVVFLCAYFNPPTKFGCSLGLPRIQLPPLQLPHLAADIDRVRRTLLNVNESIVEEATRVNATREALNITETLLHAAEFRNIVERVTKLEEATQSLTASLPTVPMLNQIYVGVAFLFSGPNAELFQDMKRSLRTRINVRQRKLLRLLTAVETPLVLVRQRIAEVEQYQAACKFHYTRNFAEALRSLHCHDYLFVERLLEEHIKHVKNVTVALGNVTQQTRSVFDQTTSITDTISTLTSEVLTAIARTNQDRPLWRRVLNWLTFTHSRLSAISNTIQESLTKAKQSMVTAGQHIDNAAQVLTRNIQEFELLSNHTTKSLEVLSGHHRNVLSVLQLQSITDRLEAANNVYMNR